MRTYSVFIRLIVVVVGQREMDLEIAKKNPPNTFLDMNLHGLERFSLLPRFLLIVIEAIPPLEKALAL